MVEAFERVGFEDAAGTRGLAALGALVRGRATKGCLVERGLRFVCER